MHSNNDNNILDFQTHLSSLYTTPIHILIIDITSIRSRILSIKVLKNIKSFLCISKKSLNEFDGNVSIAIHKEETLR